MPGKKPDLDDLPRLEDLWQADAAKIGGMALVAVISDMRDRFRGMESWQTKVDEKLDAIKDVNEDHTRKLDGLSNAFPDKDGDGHRRWHDGVIERAKSRSELAKAVREKTIPGLVWMGIVSIAGWVGAHIPKILELFK